MRPCLRGFIRGVPKVSGPGLEPGPPGPVTSCLPGGIVHDITFDVDQNTDQGPCLEDFGTRAGSSPHRKQ